MPYRPLERTGKIKKKVKIYRNEIGIILID